MSGDFSPPTDTDVIIIGAGPAGAAAAAQLARSGHGVRVLERSHFPRFSIGESLLPQCMAYLDAAGLLDTVRAGGYQPKNGAAFTRNGHETAIDFRDKFSAGWGTTYQVERADFDQRLIQAAAGYGAKVSFGVTVTEYTPDAERRWRALIAAEPRLRTLLGEARPLRPVGELKGYPADVVSLHGPGYALLGNAGEFLDPVFSSGVTIALRSAGMAPPLVERQLRGEPVDWDADFEVPLRAGIATFRAFVEAWYDGRLQKIIFHTAQPADLRRKISAVLAGYAWDRDNPFITAAGKRLTTLAQLCGWTTATPRTRQGKT